MSLLIPGTNSIKDTGYDVANSLRLNSSSSEYLQRTYGTPTNAKIFGLSWWMKISGDPVLGTGQFDLWGERTDSSNRVFMGLDGVGQFDFFEKRIREINRDLNEKEGIEIENPYIVARPFIRKIIVENRKINLLEDNPVSPNFEIPEPQITGQESRITTPQINTPPVNANILATGAQNISSTLPANFANLSTADKIKTLQDLGIRIG